MVSDNSANMAEARRTSIRCLIVSMWFWATAVNSGDRATVCYSVIAGDIKRVELKQI